MLGRDPATRRKTARETHDEQLFPAILSKFERQYRDRPTRSWHETKRTLQRECLAAWKHYRLADISRREVAQIVHAIRDKRSAPSAANHTFAAIRTFFNWALREELVAKSPCAGLKMPASLASRERVLRNNELQSIWQSAEAIGYPFGTIVQLLTLTAQRRHEVAGMKWEDLNLEQNEWVIPANANKSGRTHIVPLNPTALGVIATLPKHHPTLVFPARGSDNSVSGFSKWKSQLDQKTGLTDWTLHDIRRTVASRMAEIGVEPHIIERILNHKSGSLSGVAGIYNKYGYLTEMRNAFMKWEQALRLLLSRT
jgi:integrase